MAAPQIASLPEFLDLTGGMQVVLTALDATTGATVSGVAISQAYLDVEYVEAEAATPAVPLEDYLPQFTYGVAV